MARTHRAGARSRASLTDAQIDAQIPAARARARAERRAGLCATSARYDGASGRVLLELTNGHLVGIAAHRLPALAHATPAQRAAVSLGGAGSILRWEALDADYSVPALILSLVGRAAAAREAARVAGSVRSEAKAAAARANGAKGGRPRTKAAW